MKKYVFVGIAVFFGIIGLSATAHADTLKCGVNVTAETETASSTTFIQNCGGGDPMKVVNAWGLTGYQTPHVDAGAMVTDEGGFSTVCPKFTNVMGCSDISRTDYYRNQIETAARGIISNGSIAEFPQFKYWINLVR